MSGDITTISSTLTAVKSALIITMALMSMITLFAGMLLGSGNAPRYAFGPLIPGMTAQIGAFIATITLPMQLSSGIEHCISSIVGVVIAISGTAELGVVDIVKECSIPAVIAYICNLVVSYPVV